MFEDDYIIRMIEQIGDILRKALKLESSMDYKKAHGEIEKAMMNLGISPLLARTMPAETLMNFVSRPGEKNEDRFILLARLMAGDAHIFKSEGEHEKAHELYKTSIEILTGISGKLDGEKLKEAKSNMESIRYMMTENIRDDKTMPGL